MSRTKEQKLRDFGMPVEADEPRPWYLGRPRDVVTSPKLRGPGIFSPTGRPSLWNGRVLEEGMTGNDNRWLYVIFEGFGRPFSIARGEQPSAAFIELHVGRSEAGRRELHARVRFAVSRDFDPEDEAPSVYVYGPYIVEVSEATNKWEMAKLAIDKALPLYMKSPLQRGGGVNPDDRNGPGDDLYELDTEWVSETLFPEHMIRGLRGLEGDVEGSPLPQEPGGVRAKSLKKGDKINLWGQTVEILRVDIDSKGVALNFKYLTGLAVGQYGHEDVPAYDTRTFVLR